MSAQIALPVTSVSELPDQTDRRHGNRTPAVFSLFYSGMDKDQLLIADGILEWRSHCALPRAESLGLLDVVLESNLVL
jgi:hypothetical protein